MKKYNLSNIMKRAWEMVKNMGMTISEGLKKAWLEEKIKVELDRNPKTNCMGKHVMMEVIKKWNIHIGYKGYKKGLMIDPEISEEDFEYAKEHKHEIMAYLEEKKEKEDKERQEKFRRDYFEKEHSKELDESMRTGEWVVYAKGMEPCNDPREECDWDWVVRYLKVTENGIETKQERQHTW